MASRLDFSQIRSLYVGTIPSTTVDTNNLIVAGNVGIGTTAPTSLLHIQGTPPGTSGSMINVRDSAASGSNTSFSGVFFNSNPGTDYSIGKLSSGSDGLFQIRNGNNGTGYLTINNSGNVGIGTTSPASLVHIDRSSSSNNITGTPSIIISNRNSTSGTFIGGGIFNNAYRDVSDSSITAGVWFENQNSTGAGALAKQSAIVFGAQSYATGYNTPSERMRITADGNVGINTTGPTSKFQVNNNAGTGSAFYVDAGNPSGTTVLFEHTGANTPVPFAITKSGYSGSSTDFGVLYIDMAHDVVGGGSNMHFTLRNNAGSRAEYGGLGASIVTNTAGNTAGRLNFYTTNAGATRNIRMVINPDGNVGIGTTGPDATLRVEGIVSINGEGNGVLIDSGATSVARVGFMKYGGYEGMLVAGNATLLRLAHRTDSTAVYGGTPTIREDLVITAAGNVGIGTTTPSGLWSGTNRTLQIQSASNTSNELRQSRDAGVVGAASITRFLSGTSNTFGVYTGDALDYSLYTNNAERFRITSGGNVGINTTNPLQRLHVVGAVVGGNTATTGLPNTSGVTTQLAFEARSTQTGNDPSIAYHKEAIYTMYLQGQNSPRGLRLYSPTGETTANFYVQGDVVAFSSSDRRLKDNLSPIPNALDKVSKLTGYEFDWNENQSAHSGHDYGVVAQEVEAVLPELVQTREDGYKAVKYDKIVSVLIEAIKELTAKVEELESKLK